MQRAQPLPESEAPLSNFATMHFAATASAFLLGCLGLSSGACSFIEDDQSISSASRGVRSNGGDRGYDDPDLSSLSTGDDPDSSFDSIIETGGEPTETNNAESGGHVQVEDATADDDGSNSTESSAENSHGESTESSSAETNGEETTGESTSTNSGESLGDDSTGSSEEGTSESTGETEPDNTVPIIVPEVYSADQRIGYLIGMDETAVLKIWDDVHHNIYRINEKTGYLVGISEYKFFSDNLCTVPFMLYGPKEGSLCYRGSPNAAKVVFAEGGNQYGTTLGTSLKTYSSSPTIANFYEIVTNQFRDVGLSFPRNPDDPSILCYDGQWAVEIGKVFPESSARSVIKNTYEQHDPNQRVFVHKGCLHSIDDIAVGSLAWPLPIEIRFSSEHPLNHESNTYASDNRMTAATPETIATSQTTLRVYAADQYIGDYLGFNDALTPLVDYSKTGYRGEFVGFNDELITVFDQIRQRIFKINKVTGIVWGGRGLHAFADESCTAQHLSHTDYNRRQFCQPIPEKTSPPRKHLWSLKGDPDGWSQGQFILSTIGPYKNVETIYWTPWYHFSTCIAQTNQCVMDAEKIDDFPLSFPTPIEVRREVRE